MPYNDQGVPTISSRAKPKKSAVKAPSKAAKAPSKAAKATSKKPAPTKKAVKPVTKKAVLKKPKPSSVAPKAAAPSASYKSAAALCKQIAKLLDTNKAEEIRTLDIGSKCSFADFMIVASGRAPRHVAALADYVADHLKKQGTPALSVEGKDSGDWVLIDAGDVVVHIFRPEVRQFYNIEKMWSVG